MRKMKIIWLTLLMVLIVAAQAAAATPEKIVLEKNHSTYLDLWGMESVAIANPEIADITVVSGREILIIAKQQGSTSLQVKFKSGNRKEYAVIVTDGDKAMAESVEDMINYPNVTVSKVGENIVLDGTVEDQIEKKRAETIAGMYAKKVVNLLEMENPKQIKIEAKIVEINSDKINKFGFQYFNASKTEFDENTGITVTPGTTGNFMAGQNFGEGPYGWFGDYAGINASLTALITNGQAKLLSQPNMVTMSGEKANILIGGEIPIPISNSDGQITVEWREYGIKLDIEPNVDSANQISSKVNAEVSTLDNGSARVAISTSGITIPALRSRKAETMITLKSGSTMAIGGLISSEDSKSIMKLPLLGDLPILGQFFRHTVKNKDRKEIIILITPTLVDENYQTPMSYKMKSYISEKTEEEKKLAKSPEQLKKEEEEAKAAKEKTKAEEAKAKADAETKQKAEAKAKENAEKLKKEQEKADTDKAKVAEKVKADKVAAEKLAKIQVDSKKQKSVQTEKNVTTPKGAASASAMQVKVEVKPTEKQAPPPLEKKVAKPISDDAKTAAKIADKKPQKVAR